MLHTRILLIIEVDSQQVSEQQITELVLIELNFKGKCVAIDATRKGRIETPGKWIYDHCTARKAVICQRS